MSLKSIVAALVFVVMSGAAYGQRIDVAITGEYTVTKVSYGCQLPEVEKFAIRDSSVVIYYTDCNGEIAKEFPLTSHNRKEFFFTDGESKFTIGRYRQQSIQGENDEWIPADWYHYRFHLNNQTKQLSCIYGCLADWEMYRGRDIKYRQP